MDIYTDYANWKFENHELINTLIKLKSKIISRFSHSILVVDKLYEEFVENGELSPELEVIFDTGFNYIHDHFMTIQDILKSEYRSNISQMDQNSKTINLLLYVKDFEAELLNQPNYKDSDLNKLSNFEDKVNEYVEKHQEVPDEMFGLLDDMTVDMFDDYQGINDILYEVALELNLIKSEDHFDEMDMVFGKLVK